LESRYLILVLAAAATLSAQVTPAPGNIGVFRAGQWWLDINGDHRWTCDPLLGPCEGTSGNDVLFNLNAFFGGPQAADIAVLGDWDNTGTQRSGVFRNGQWFVDVNNDHQWTSDRDAVYTFGQAGDIPVVGDWDNTGVQRIGVFRNGQWFVNLNNDHSTATEIDFGQPGDLPVVGDWDNTGIQRIGVFRAGQWILDLNNDHQFTADQDLTFQFGQPGDIPIVGDWTHTSGVQRIGVFRNGSWLLDINNDHQWTQDQDALFLYGNAGDQPLVYGPTRWIAAWGASISYVESATTAFPALTAIAGPDATLNEVTIRQIVHLTPTATSWLRLKFSNALADPATSVTIDDVHIAASAGGGKITTGTDQAVTFNGGSPSVTLAGTSEINTDPVSFPAGLPADMTVSIHVLNGGNNGFSVHPVASSTVYFAPATDATAACTDQDPDTTGCAPYQPACTAANNNCTRPLLTAVELYAPGPASNTVVTIGDSITDGVGSSQDGNHRWPDYLATALANAGSNTKVVNSGIGADCLLTNCGGGPTPKDRFQRDVLSVPGVKYLVVLIGVNDILFVESTAAEIIAGYQDLIARAHAEGLLIYAGTVTPFGGFWNDDPNAQSHEQVRTDVNQFIRGATCASPAVCFDGFIDFDQAVADPSNPSFMLWQYTWMFADPTHGDRLHPNDNGYQAMAGAIDLSLFSR
jgi:lysophospholipase L1-like esterase